MGKARDQTGSSPPAEDARPSRPSTGTGTNIGCGTALGGRSIFSGLRTTYLYSAIGGA